MASPGDLSVERQLVQDVVERLGRMPQIENRVVLRALSWETGVPPILGDAPQTLVDRYLGAPRNAEILVLLIGGRLGARFVDERTGLAYPSGTEYELDNAYEAYRRKGRPIVLVYRQEGLALDAASPEERERVAAFWARFEGPNRHYQGIDPKRFSSNAVLLDYLFRDLSNVIYRIERADRRRRWLLLVGSAIVSAVLGWATHGWYQQQQTEIAVNRIVDSALERETAGGALEAIWEPVTDALVALGPRAVRPTFDRLGDPRIYEGKNHEGRADQSPTRALVRALARQGVKGERDTVCGELFQILHSGGAPLRYPKSTHRIVIKDGIAPISCPGAEPALCAYLAHVGPNSFVRPTSVFIDLRDAASPPLPAEEAARCFGRRGS